MHKKEVFPAFCRASGLRPGSDEIEIPIGESRLYFLQAIGPIPRSCLSDKARSPSSHRLMVSSLAFHSGASQQIQNVALSGKIADGVSEERDADPLSLSPAW